MPKMFGNLNQSKPWNAAFPRKATEADIVSCFRLLLGRTPGEQEWGGHKWRVGEDLESVVGSYLNSQEFARRHLLDNSVGQWQLVDLSTFKMFAPAADKSIGKTIIHNREYERPVTQVFKKFLQPGMSVLDLGANIGYFSFLASSLVGPDGFVQSWEPSPHNVRALCASRQVNGFTNIDVIQAAATEGNGVLQYFRSSINGCVAALENTSPDDLFTAETVMGLRVDDLLPPEVSIGFVKIDVEGWEFRALRGARKTIERCRPVIVSEFAPPSLKDASGVTGREYLEFLTSLGYKLLSMTMFGLKERSIEDILARFEQCGKDHIDIVLIPRA